MSLSQTVHLDLWGVIVNPMGHAMQMTLTVTKMEHVNELNVLPEMKDVLVVFNNSVIKIHKVKL